MFKVLKKYLFILLGTLSLALGIVGILLPVLPTTPFLLLSAFCYLRSSGRLYQWLIHQKLLGPYIYNYITYRAVPKATKIFALIFLWGTLLISAFLIDHWHVKILLLLVGIGVTIHLLTLKTLKKPDKTMSGTASALKSKESP